MKRAVRSDASSVRARAASREKQLNANHNLPRVSVVIPAFNCGDYIVEAIASVVAQDYPDIEIVVVDDGSSDDTAAKVTSAFPEVLYIRQENAGSAIARNRGILASSGELVAFLDADDLWLPGKLDKQVRYLMEHPEVSLVYTDFSRSADVEHDISSRLATRKFWTQGSEFLSLLRQNFLHTSSVILRRKILADSGIFDPKFRNAQDWDLWIRVGEVGRFALIDEVLTRYRLHPDQAIKSPAFRRNVVYADKVLMARYAGNAKAIESLRQKTGHDYWLLGRAELRAGNRSAARHAYWGSCRNRHKTVQSVLRAAACLLPGIRARPRRSD